MAEGRREPICEYYSGGRKRIQHNTNTLHVLFVPMKIHAVRADEPDTHAAALVGNEDDPFVDTTDTVYFIVDDFWRLSKDYIYYCHTFLLCKTTVFYCFKYFYKLFAIERIS